MKKWLALVLTVTVLAALFPVSASAGGNDLVKILMSSQGVTAASAQKDQAPTAQELDDAIEAGSDLIPEGCKLVPGRVSLMYTQCLSCEEEVYDVTFKVWSTLRRTVGLFFRAEGEEDWQLVTCNLGDIIEGRFQSNGTCAIVVGW